MNMIAQRVIDLHLARIPVSVLTIADHDAAKKSVNEDVEFFFKTGGISLDEFCECRAIARTALRNAKERIEQECAA